MEDRTVISLQDDILKRKQELRVITETIIDLEIEKSNYQFKIDNLDWNLENGKID